MAKKEIKEKKAAGKFMEENDLNKPDRNMADKIMCGVIILVFAVSFVMALISMLLWLLWVGIRCWNVWGGYSNEKRGKAIDSLDFCLSDRRTELGC